MKRSDPQGKLWLQVATFVNHGLGYPVHEPVNWLIRSLLEFELGNQNGKNNFYETDKLMRQCKRYEVRTTYSFPTERI